MWSGQPLEGVAHYVRGDDDGGNKAMRAATRTTVCGCRWRRWIRRRWPGASRAGSIWDVTNAAITDGSEDLITF